MQPTYQYHRVLYSYYARSLRFIDLRLLVKDRSSKNEGCFWFVQNLKTEGSNARETRRPIKARQSDNGLK